MLQIKDLGRPQNLARVSQDTLAKMNRVIVNVVNKMKDIGQVSIMKRGKASFESTTAALAQSFAALGDQFEKTWNNLEVRYCIQKLSFTGRKVLAVIYLVRKEEHIRVTSLQYMILSLIFTCYLKKKTSNLL